MRYQYKREPLTQEEANRLANACSSHEEKLVIWTLLDTGLRVAELAKPPADDLRQRRPVWKIIKAQNYPVVSASTTPA